MSNANNPEKIDQHYVPRLYLRAWTIDNRLFRLMNGKIEHKGTKAFAKERYFYKLHGLTEADIRFIERAAIHDSPTHLQPRHRTFVRMFSEAPKLMEKVADIQPTPTALHVLLTERIVNTEENFHEKIERHLKRSIDCMLAGDITFYSDDEELAGFFWHISVQYMRTNAMRQAMYSLRSVPESGASMERVWNILSHIFAVNIGWSLFADRKLFQLVLLDNSTSTPFITGDQPIINTHGSIHTGISVSPGQLELFYPLSPRKAMLLAAVSDGQADSVRSVSAMEVETYNFMIVRNSPEQLFCDSKEYLETMKRFL
jgi:hypothetical protein